MKNIILLAAAVCVAFSANAQISTPQISDFEDGTVQGWTNGAASPNQPTNIPTGGPLGADDNFLEEISAGGSGAGSKLVIQNDDSDWTGDYLGAGVGLFSADVKNGGTEDLFLRVALQGGSDNTRMYTDNSFTLPASQTTWTSFDLVVDNSANWTIVSGASTVEQVLQDVSQIRILSSQSGGFNGDAVAGVLHIDNITADDIFIGFDDNIFNNLVTYPNPVSDILNIESTVRMDNYQIFNVAGQLVSVGELEEQFLQVSNLSEGLYFLKLSNVSGSRTIKFVKR
ncbi:MAG: T9SS type A sorting domain-containing protein [Bacteroidia bacterium]|nr:T9SS type A sorting domain-containing protein [Bacteroidia bacterium]NNF31187.1 T9SS type A sorting domain-containing protein [Flavobacteriaceae bacterium]MBT8274821.1 T9SS type A sorting domain-containing protein [Bacteroidia bacterium]NNJ80634.1 T9SS type A sorting domain-containing protein [Flavobacteriaceae bacterium]NNK54617.1 T9SS type A sorting domain-containing protein [Flavobacteriaceae bacterium]